MHNHDMMRHEKRQRVRSTGSAETDFTIPVTDPEGAPTRATRTRATTTRTTQATTRARAAESTTSLTTPSTTSISTSSSLSSSVLNASNAADAAGNNSASSSSKSTNVGMIVGIVLAILGVAIVAGLIFFFVKKRKARSANAGFGFGRKEKADDERSFIGAGGLVTDHSMEKSGNFGLSESGHASQMPMQMNNAMPWSHPNNDMPMQPPPFAPAPAGQPTYPPAFAPPQASMMNAPAARLSVTNPYSAAQLPSQPTVASNNLATPAAGAATSTDNSPFEDPQWANKLFKVTRSFQPSMPDELIIMPNDRVRILMAYDDGWCLGENLDSVPAGSPHQPVRGVFPKDCVEEIVSTVAPTQSSLQRAPTLPPLDMGRASQTFADKPSSSSPTKGAQSKTQQHLSTSSSLNHESSMIDEFPSIPNNRSGAGTPVKRTSSLIAGKDSELFAALALSDDQSNLR